MSNGSESAHQIHPLSSAPDGARVKVRAVQGGHGMLARLADLGILPGVQLKVVRATRGGPVIVEVKGGRVIIGRGMASRIEVEAVPTGAPNTNT